MDPTQPPTPPKEQPQQQSAVAYYNKNRKRSFLFSRLTVIGSMFILIIALTVNIISLTSPSENTTQSHASTGENPKKILPHLPKGCTYKDISGGFIVVCPSITPTSSPAVSINVALPQLPPQCGFETTASGSAVRCEASHAPIPPVAVTLPSTCTLTKQPDTVTCTDKNNKQTLVPLPSLPEGCSYTQFNNATYVLCQPK